MLLSETDCPFNDSSYLYEIKFDGIRALIYIGPKDFQIISRNGRDITYLYPELKNVSQNITEKLVLDGEIISMRAGKPDFSQLQKRSHLKEKSRIEIESQKNPVVFAVFDIVYKNKNLISLPLLERKILLDAIIESDYLIKSKTFKDGKKLFAKIEKMGLEGIVAKKVDSTYEIDTRSKTWIKIKNFQREYFFIGGYIERKTDVISLLLGEYVGGKLHFVGNVALRKNTSLYSELKRVRILKKSPFKDYQINTAVYITPELKCPIKYIKRTENNHLRQPVIDKNRAF